MIGYDRMTQIRDFTSHMEEHRSIDVVQFVGGFKDIASSLVPRSQT